jgi:HSP20 family molecular chaperone IbpA
MTAIEKAEEAREPPDLFSRWFGDLTWPRLGEFLRPEMWTHFESALRVEEYREGDEFVVPAKMPGIGPDKDVVMSAWRERASRRSCGEGRVHSSGLSGCA